MRLTPHTQQTYLESLTVITSAYRTPLCQKDRLFPAIASTIFAVTSNLGETTIEFSVYR
jgi:hypothetical protein